MAQNLTVADGMREIELLKERKHWKDAKKSEMLFDSWQTRGCFQSNCAEWKQTTIEEKVDLLSDLINQKDYDTLQLSLTMMEYGNSKFNKNIKEKDLIIGMSKIIDFLIKKEHNKGSEK